MNRRQFIATAGALATAGLAGCSATGSDDNDGDQSGSDPRSTNPPGADDGGTDPPATETAMADLGDVDGSVIDTAQHLDVESHQLFESWSGVGVTGRVENTGETPYSLVEVELYLSDGDERIGDFTDTTETELDTLDPGEKWRFYAAYEDVDRSQIEGYRINVDGETADGS